MKKEIVSFMGFVVFLYSIGFFVWGDIDFRRWPAEGKSVLSVFIVIAQIITEVAVRIKKDVNKEDDEQKTGRN